MDDPELDRFKHIDFIRFAVERYGYEYVRRDSGPHSLVLRSRVDDDKLVARRNPDGHWTYFSIRDENDNGTILDFVQRRGGRRSLGEVRKELRSWLGFARPERDLAVYAAPSPALAPAEARAAVQERFEAARSAGRSAYLESRGLSPQTHSCARFAGTWRIGSRENVLFPHRDLAGELTGFEAKNRGFTSFSAGGTKSLWQSASLPGDRALVVVEAPIDAMSHYQLRGEGAHACCYLSTAGTPGTRQLEMLSALFATLPPRTTVVSAVDFDEAGYKLSERLRAMVSRHSQLSFACAGPAPEKDWNDALQRRLRERSLALER